MTISRYSRRYFLAAVAALSCIAATPIHNTELNFRATIPDGFVPNPEEGERPGVLYSFVSDPDDPDRLPAAIRIARVGGLLPEDDPMKSFTKQGIKFDVTPEKWKGHTVRLSRGAMTHPSGHRVVTLNVLVPLKPEGLSITVAGHEGQEQELTAVLRAVLGSVEGESSWGDREAQNRAESRIAWDCFVTLALIGLIVLLFYSRRRRRAAGTL